MPHCGEGGAAKDRPVLGLALGGGAARGIAHIGVLQVLEEERIPIAVIAGTSVGALIGALYGAGVDLEWLARLAVNLKWDHLVDLTVPGLGFIRPDKMAHLVKLLTREKSFADLRVRFAAVAVDIETGEEVVITDGSLVDAVIASSSIPGIFVPRRVGGRLLVDGGLVNRVPVDVARRLGADVVIGVDVGTDPRRVKVRNILDVIFQAVDIMQNRIFEYRLSGADVLIHPDLGGMDPSNLDEAEFSLEAGRAAARVALPQIKRCLQQLQPPSGVRPTSQGRGA